MDDEREWCSGMGTQVLDCTHVGLTVCLCPTCGQEVPVTYDGHIRAHLAHAQLQVA